MQEASAKGKSAQFKGRSDAVAPDRPRTWPYGKCSGNGESPQAATVLTGKGTKASAKRMRKAAKIGGFGLR
jgi:hypothetical protein